MSRYFSAQFYTDRVLEKSELQSFALPGNPYRMLDTILQYLRDLGIFFYRDDKHGAEGIILSRENTNGFTAWKYSVIFETDNRTFCKVHKWVEVGDAYFVRKFTRNMVVGVRINGPAQTEGIPLSISADTAKRGGLELLLPNKIQKR